MNWLDHQITVRDILIASEFSMLAIIGVFAIFGVVVFFRALFDDKWK